MRACQSNRLPHAWLLSGPRGIGKATLAYRFARFLLKGEGEGGLFGDQFGAFEASTNFDGSTDDANVGALRGRDNDHEGVYIDDLIQGLNNIMKFRQF